MMLLWCEDKDMLSLTCLQDEESLQLGSNTPAVEEMIEVELILPFNLAEASWWVCIVTHVTPKHIGFRPIGFAVEDVPVQSKDENDKTIRYGIRLGDYCE